jgi:hypothetical protein
VTWAVLGAKSVLAVLLLVSGAAKLADLAGFAAVVRLFLPARVSARTAAGLPAAAVAAAAELLAGAVSLCWPTAYWVNLAVLALMSGFTVVAALGYARYRGRACRCLGSLTRRGFGALGLLQAVLITGVAALAARPVRPAALQFGAAGHVLLLAAAAVTALAAYTAAVVLTDRPAPGLAG